MSAVLAIESPGAYSTIQDFGRYGYQAMGVPVSGVLDPDSLRLANRLVGNPASTAGLEVLYHGPSLTVEADSVRLAVGGIGATIDLLDGSGARLPAWRSVTVLRGETLRISPGPGQSNCVLAVAGGFDLPACLGSHSTYARAGFGGFHGRILQSGDRLPLTAGEAPGGPEQVLPDPPVARNDPIRVTWGLQRNYFTDRSLDDFLSQPFRILTDSDRMGFRIDGPQLAHRDGYDIVSDGIPTGAIQVPGSGQPVILLADHQTTGGYPKIANVISADLPALGRRCPGDEVRFSVVSVSKAEQIRREHESWLQTLENRIETFDAEPGLNLKALYESNLISGAVADTENP